MRRSIDDGQMALTMTNALPPASKRSCQFFPFFFYWLARRDLQVGRPKIGKLALASCGTDCSDWPGPLVFFLLLQTIIRHRSLALDKEFIICGRREKIADTIDDDEDE